MAGRMGPTGGESWMRWVERAINELKRHNHVLPIEDKIMDRIRSRPLLQGGGGHRDHGGCDVAGVVDGPVHRDQQRA